MKEYYINQINNQLNIRMKLINYNQTQKNIKLCRFNYKKIKMKLID